MRWLLEAIRTNGLAVVLALLAIGLVSSSLTGRRGLAGAWSLGQEVSEAEQQNFSLVQEIPAIRSEIEALRHDDAILERVARRQAHLVRPGETLYRLPSADR